jgi:hypothetical protein
LAESYTHADGVIGHIRIGEGRKADTSFVPNVKHFVVAEAKMFSRFSKGVKNAPYFNQASRYSACIAELLCGSGRRPSDLKRLGLYVLAPEETIQLGWFEKPSNKADIRQKVERRVQAYEGQKDLWFSDWFLPALEKMDIGCLSWESILEHIGSVDAGFSMALRDFYFKCVSFNRSDKYKFSDQSLKGI